MEETISLKEIFDVIKKKFLLILSFIIGAAIISTIISYVFLTPTYESSSQFIVNQSEQDKSTNYNVNDIRSNVELINTYNIIIKSPAILEEVVKELNLSYSDTQLQNKINVLNEENSQVVTVTVTDTNSNLATQIANTTVQIFQTKIPDLMNVDNVHTLSEAEMKENPSPVSPRPMLNIAIAVVLGGMIGVGTAFLLEYLDNTIKSEEDVENTLNLPVLGVITHINDGDVQQKRFKPTLNRSDRRRLYGSKKG
ncbi:YveK family protein [Virgibacillus litoralis]|uniref:Capsular polysaccharide biosynthesis protein n=1 Tax=Virgibacillus litoralis TaxID=578221 RepID=A0ABS4HI29_9BACI|nr:Wzz/FepE/Etk N-terminal domain-containing protein [Virgibacillus litoralis]MBP1950577.1 capsular polysaccharide biosynthesis protein [Virgibacillus litoralis]